MSFASDTSVRRVGERCFTAYFEERWLSLVGIHGGYSAAVVARSIEAAVDDPDRALRSFATQFAAAPRPGPAEIEVTVERAGRSMTTTSARLYEGRLLQVAHAVSSPSRPGLAYDELVRPRGADPGASPIFEPPGGVAHFQNAEVRLDPDVPPGVVHPLAVRSSSRGQAHRGGWLHDRQHDPYRGWACLCG